MMRLCESKKFRIRRIIFIYIYYFFNYIIFRKSKITKLVTKKIFNQRSMKLKKEKVELYFCHYIRLV